MKRKIFFLVVVLFAPILLFGLTNTASAQFDYSGSIDLDGNADGFLQGTGSWSDTGPTSLSWDVTWDGNVSSLVHYSYTFTVNQHDISHFTLELSDNFTASDISNVTINGNSSVSTDIDTWDKLTNPHNTMPGDVYGIKFDLNAAKTTSWTLEFDSTRMPEWGDFYARCGSRVEHTLPKTDPNWKEWNSAWNTGFASSETAGAGNDPVMAASSGSYTNHILVPDTVVVPEPISSSLFIIGGSLLAGRRFFRRKK